jgi:hypothetical protein
MPGERLSMRILEVLRLRFGQGLSQRVIGQSLRLSVGAANAYLSRSRMAGLGWPLPAKFDDAQLETLRANAAWIAPCSTNSPAATGSATASIW